jgi:hypothetical protein
MILVLQTLSRGWDVLCSYFTLFGLNKRIFSINKVWVVVGQTLPFKRTEMDQLFLEWVRELLTFLVVSNSLLLRDTYFISGPSLNYISEKEGALIVFSDASPSSNPG